MAYVIDTRDGQQIVITDEALNEDLSIKLVGRNFANYGEPIAENFLDLLTNFATTTPPARAISGQTWFDTTTDQLRVYDQNAAWRSVSSIIVEENAEPQNDNGLLQEGLLYYDKAKKQLYVRADREFDSEFDRIGIPGEIINPTGYLNNALVTAPANVPADVTDEYGNRLRNVFLRDSSNTYRAVLALDYQSNTQNAMVVFSGHDDFAVNVGATHYSDGETVSGAYVTQITNSENLGTTIYRGMNVHEATISDLRVGNAVISNSNTAVIGSVSDPFAHGYFETVTANINGNFTGNILSSDGSTVILDNGAIGTDAIFTGNVIGQTSRIDNHSTTDLAEGDNLYYTTARVRNNVSVDAQSNLLYSNVTGVFSHQLTTTDVVEGDNLYYTTARVRANVSVTNTGTGFGDLSYDEPNGVFSYDRVTSAEIRAQLSDGSGISYNSATGIIAVDEANVNHDNLSGFVSNEHIDHSTVSIVAGAGLVGGGNITATRSIDIGQGYGISVGTTGISVSNAQIRNLFSISSSSQGILSFDNSTGQISYLGDSDVAASNLNTWVRTANVAQTVFGVKSWQNEVRFENAGTSNNIVISNDPTIAYGAPGLSFSGASGNVFFGSTGSIVASDDITAFSDRKLKTNLVQIDSALDKVCALTGYIYERLDRPGKRQTGLIAQDVEQVLPEAVSMHNDTLTVAYGNLMGLIVEAIKELKDQVQSLKQQREE